MKKLILLATILCSTSAWADFCSANNKEIQQAKQSLSTVSQSNVSVKSVDCYGDTLGVRIAMDLPTDNNTKQFIATALQQFDFKNALCATAEVKQFANQGLNKIVYTYSDTSGALITRKEIVLNKCQ